MEWAAKLSMYSGSVPCPEITSECLMILLHEKIENSALEILIKSKGVLEEDIQVWKQIPPLFLVAVLNYLP